MKALTTEQIKSFLAEISKMQTTLTNLNENILQPRIEMFYESSEDFQENHEWIEDKLLEVESIVEDFLTELVELDELISHINEQ